MSVPNQRPPAAARQFGYVVAAAITAAMWYVINIWPGWQAVSFLTDETSDVVWLVNVSLAISVAVNLVYVIYDPPWFKALGDLVTTGIGLLVLTRVWQVFPFDFSGYSFDWAVVARIALVVGIVGSCIGIVVQVVTLVRLAVVEDSPPRRQGAIPK